MIYAKAANLRIEDMTQISKINLVVLTVYATDANMYINVKGNVPGGLTMASEKRLIDANALIEEANAEGAYGYVDAFQIANAPTVDAVEVVRCKNCRKRHTKMAAEIVKLRYRVQELEERLCPCEQHQWLITNEECDVGTAPGDVTTYYTYKCRRCGKKRRTWELLHVWDGGDGNG